MTQSRPSAAVIVAAYNGAKTIDEALSSLEASASRSSDHIVAVVVDDGSTDDTAELVADFQRESPLDVRIIRHEINLGTGAARNTGVREVDADCYMFLDQDDIYLPVHIETCLGALAEDPRLDHVRTLAIMDPPVHPEWAVPIADSLVLTTCVRRHAHRLIGGFMDDPATNRVRCEDVLYRRLLSTFTRGGAIDRHTVSFRSQPGNSFERQWERKFSRPISEAEVVMPKEGLRAMPEVERALHRRMTAVSGRIERLRPKLKWE